MALPNTSASPFSEVVQALFSALRFTPTCGAVQCRCGGAVHQGGQVNALLTLLSHRYAAGTGGEQGGKSRTSALGWYCKYLDDRDYWQVCDVPYDCDRDGARHAHLEEGRCDPTLLYWLIGSEYNEVRKEFGYIAEDLRATLNPADVRVSAAIDPGFIEVYQKRGRLARPIVRIETKSARFPERIAGDAPHGIILCEAGQLSMDIYSRARRRTAPKAGWMFLIGTIERSQPWYPALCDAWSSGLGDRKSFVLPTYSNTFLYEGGRNDPEIVAMEMESSRDEFIERIEGRRVPPSGLVFGHAFSVDVHVRDVEYQPGTTLYIWVDPGYQRGHSAHAVEIAQAVPIGADGQGDVQLQIIDELHRYEITTEEAITWCEQQPWWAQSENKVLSIDPYYKDAHHAMGSVSEMWQRRTGLVTSQDNYRVPPNEADARLEAYLKVNPITNQPRLVIAPHCVGLLSEFGVVPSPHSPRGETLAYKRKLDRDNRPIGRSPESRYCDGIRAVESGIIDYEGYGKMPRKMFQRVTYRGRSRPGVRRR